MKTYTHILYRLMIVCLFIPMISWGATDSISKVVFTSDSHTVAPGDISPAITIQLQNSGGSEEKLDDTADVTFSTTGSGEFLGGTGKAITKTMSKGSANKTFYYRDNTTGDYVLKVSVTPRSGGDSWTASQTIHIGEGGESGSAEEDSGTESEDEENTEESTTSEASSSRSGSGSHSSSVKLSNYTKKVNLQTGAGRTRTVLVNTPINFDAETNQDSVSVRPQMKFLWSFGDGDSDAGRSVKHVYRFPGEYNVVLNTIYKKEIAVSRTKVIVVPAEVTISDVKSGVDGYIEIKNNSKGEINLDNWRLKIVDKDYIIPQDTIISAGQSIRFPNVITFLLPQNQVELLYPNKQVVVSYPTTPEKPIVLEKALPPPVTYNVPKNQPTTVPSSLSVSMVRENTSDPIPTPIEVITTQNKLSATSSAPAAVMQAKGMGKVIQFIQSLFTVHE
jgi:hypothetical protein